MNKRENVPCFNFGKIPNLESYSHLKIKNSEIEEIKECIEKAIKSFKNIKFDFGNKMIKYKTGISHKIIKVEVEKESEKCVWIRGHHYRKMASDEQFFDTFEDAQGYLINKARERCVDCHDRLDSAEEFLRLVKSNKK